jgi:hypothetical protein
VIASTRANEQFEVLLLIEECLEESKAGKENVVAEKWDWRTDMVNA